MNLQVFTPVLAKQIDLVELGRIEFDGSYDLWVDTEENLVYATCGYEGFKIINITDKTAPKILSEVSETSAVINTGHETGYAHQLFMKEKIAFIGDGAAGLTIINCTDKQSPFIVTHYTGGYGWDAQIVENVLYLAKSFSAGIDLVDITNLTNLTRISEIETDFAVVDLTIAGNRLYAVDAASGLSIYDITNKTHPNLVGTYNPEVLSDFVYVEVKETIAWVVTWKKGIHVVNCSDPTDIRLVGTYDDESEYYTLTIEGDLGFLAGIKEGLKIIDLSVPTEEKEVGRYYDGAREDKARVINDLVYLIGEKGLRILQMSEKSTNVDGFEIIGLMSSLVVIIAIRRRITNK